jgi:hypothetical protein
MKTKSNLERVAFIVLMGIFMYLFFVKCKTNKKLDLKNKPNYPYYYE